MEKVISTITEIGKFNFLSCHVLAFWIGKWLCFFLKSRDQHCWTAKVDPVKQTPSPNLYLLSLKLRKS